jgi:hypothetical protein
VDKPMMAASARNRNQMRESNMERSPLTCLA